MTLVLDEPTVRRVFGWADAVAALRTAYGAAQDETRFPARRIARGDHGWVRTLSGVPAGDALMGLKTIAASPRHGRVSYLISLFDQRTAELVALLDGHAITGFRTAATTALAADLLAPSVPLDVAVVGAGFEAGNHLRALAAVRDLAAVRVFSPRVGSRERFAAEHADLPVTITPTASAEAAVDGASVVVCAARSRDESPTLPEQREVDEETVERAEVLVADMVAEVLDETGDLIAARAAGIDAGSRAVSLADLVGGRHPGRTRADQVLLYKSVGSAVQDLAVAEMCVHRARRAGLGATLPLEIRPVEK